MKHVHPDDMAYVEHRYRELLSIGCIAPAEFRVTQGENKLRYLSAEVLWLEESYTFALFVKDITTARDHEEFLVKISAQKDTLLDMLLHNLSGPLHLSRDMIALLASNKSIGADSARLISMMAETTSHCIGIITQFLVEEHTESAETVVKKNRFDIHEKSRIIVDMLREMNKSKHIELRTELQYHHVTSDPVKFFQVIHNLLSNAVKYTEEEGHVSMHISGADNLISISVSDDGTGVSESVRPLLFKQKVEGEPGLRGEPSQGMGLLLCSRLAKALGGTLSYEPRKGRGSVFRFEMPQD